MAVRRITAPVSYTGTTNDVKPVTAAATDTEAAVVVKEGSLFYEWDADAGRVATYEYLGGVWRRRPDRTPSEEEADTARLETLAVLASIDDKLGLLLAALPED